MGTPDIAIVVSPRGWAERLHRFIADHGGARVRARILDAREAVDHPYAVLVVEDITSFLTPRLVSQLHDQGRRLLGVFDPGEPWGRQRLEELGVDETLPSDSSAEGFLHAIESLAATIDLDREIAALVEEPSESPRDGSDPGRGLVTAVGGPPGGPGITELTIAIGSRLHADDGPAVIVDADSAFPSIAQRLGLGLHPNLHTAIDAVEHRSGSLERSLQIAAGGLSVLAGAADGARGDHLRPGEVQAVVERLAREHRHVVVDVGCRLGPSGSGGPGPGAALVEVADRIVGVGSPTPVGVARSLVWLSDLRALAPVTPVHLVVNRAPRARFRRGELGAEIQRTARAATLAFIPLDRRVEQAAWEGTLVTSGPFARAVRVLVDEVQGAVVDTVGADAT